MSFLTVAALLVGLLVAAPVAAHLLRRRRAGDVPLPTARLLATTPPAARRRSALEDRALLSVRLLAVLALAILGATPFVSCSRLAMLRKEGASVAMVLVVDDSMSMNAAAGSSGQTRFDKSKAAATDLLSALQAGDSVAIVLAGAEARVHLSATTDHDVVQKAIAALGPTDRATDLDAALLLARDLLRLAPQTDKRVVLLSDLADGQPGAPPLDVDAEVSLWHAVPDLTARGETDCGILSAERAGDRVTVTLRCTEGASASGRTVALDAAGKELAREQVPDGATEMVLKIPPETATNIDARLSAGDAIASDDGAPVIEHARDLSLAVVADAAASHVQTGGPPPVERALAALELASYAKPLPAIPEHTEELAAHAGLVLDDPPGLTPEERRTVAAWIEEGGTALIALGRRSAAAPLGAGFGEIIPGVVRWRSDAPSGADVARCAFLGASAEGLSELAARGRASLDHEAMGGAEVLCAWTDGAPLLLRRVYGRGSVIVSTLPFELESSDLPLRPAFLALLDEFVELARARGGSRVVEAGGAFALHGFAKVSASHQLVSGGAPTEVPVQVKAGTPLVIAPRIGRYALTLDGVADVRYATAPPREIDLRPRPIAPRAVDPALGGQTEQIDASPYVAFALLALLVLELGLRAFSPAPKR